MGPNPFRHIPKKTKTLVFVKEDRDDKAKNRILLPLMLTPPPSERTRTRIRTKKIYLTLSAILVSRKVIIPISVLKRSQKLASISTMSKLVTEDSEETILVSAKKLERIIYI